MAQAGTTSLTKWPSTRAGNDDDGDNDDNNDQDDDNDDDEDDENDAALRAPASRLLRRPLRNGCGCHGRRLAACPSPCRRDGALPVHGLAGHLALSRYIHGPLSPIVWHTSSTALA